MATRLKLRKNGQQGFTLIELIIVISIMMILMGIAVPAFQAHVMHAKEAVLREDLYTMRTAIDQFTQDKDKAPQGLDELVQIAESSRPEIAAQAAEIARKRIQVRQERTRPFFSDFCL